MYPKRYIIVVAVILTCWVGGETESTKASNTFLI